MAKRVTRLTLVSVQHFAGPGGWTPVRHWHVDTCDEDAPPHPDCEIYGVTRRINEHYRVDFHKAFKMDFDLAARVVDERHFGKRTNDDRYVMAYHRNG